MDYSLEKKSGSARLVLLVLRAAAAIIGTWLFCDLTYGLLKGEITYSVGEVDSVTVTTSGFAETLLVYFTFCPLGLGLMAAGIAPELYVKYPRFLKTLLTTAFCAYVLSNLW